MKRLSKEEKGNPNFNSNKRSEYKNKYVYRGPSEFKECKGEGCSEQATKKVANMFGTDYNSLNPQDAWYKRKAVLNGGGKEVYNSSSNPDLKTTYDQLNVGDFVSLDRAGSPHINDKSKVPGYSLEDNEGTEHLGYIIGFNEQGVPLVRHGHQGSFGEAKSFVQPIDQISLPDIGATYDVKSIYRAKPLLDKIDPNDQKYYRELKPSKQLAFNPDAKLTKDKKKFIDAFNKNSDAFQMESGLDPEEVAAIGNIAYGIFGNESTFNESLKRVPKQIAATLLYELGLKKSSPSAGPTQLKYQDTVKNADGTLTRKGRMMNNLKVNRGGLSNYTSPNYDDVTKATFGNLAENYREMKNDPDYEYDPQTNTVFGNVPVGYALARSWKQPNVKNLKKILQSNDSDYSKAVYENMKELVPAMFPSELQEVVVTAKKKQYGGVIDKLNKYVNGGDAIMNTFKVNEEVLGKFMNDPMGYMGSAMINDYLNPTSMSNVVSNLSAGAGMIENYNRRRYDENRLRDQGSTDNMIPVDQQSDRGNYVTTGSSYGMFRPDQMGAKSPDGMYNGMYYPTMALGGSLISEEMDSTPVMLSDTGTREMVAEFAIPEFATIPVGLASRKSFENVVDNVSYNPNKEVDINNNTKFAYNYYTKNKKLPAHIAAGIVGNLYQESGLKPSAVETTNTANGRGIAQWDKRNRWKAYLNWANQNGLNPYDLTSQLDYVLVEPGESSKALEKLKSTTTPEQAAVIFGKLYERPSEKHANWSVRTSVAKKLYNGKFKDGGEIELTDEEIFEAKRNGYDVEFL